MQKVSIILPSKDEEGTIGLVLDDLIKVTDNLKSDYNFELIVINDCSKDRTAEIAAGFKDVMLYSTDKPLGKGNALNLGFQKSSGEIIIMMDSDCSHRAAEIPLFLEKIQEGADLVIGSRFFGGSDEYSPIRHFGNTFLTFCFNFLFQKYIKDVLNGYKAFRRELIDNFKYVSRSYEIEIELLANAAESNMLICEIPSYERRRAAGKEKSRIIIHGFKFLTMIIKRGIKFRKFIK